jgi:hypothetical protein
MRRLRILLALALVTGLTTSSTIPVGAATGWITNASAWAEGWAWWAPEVEVYGQSMAYPWKMRVVVRGLGYGNMPFDTIDDGDPGWFWVDWELCCFDMVDPVGTEVCKSGDLDILGQTRITKKWTSMKGVPLYLYDYCHLQVEAMMGGTGKLKVKTQAKY